MIKLFRLNDTDFVLNGEIIETIECTPDTVVTTINGKKYIVKDSVEEVIEKVIEYKGRIKMAGK